MSDSTFSTAVNSGSSGIYMGNTNEYREYVNKNGGKYIEYEELSEGKSSLEESDFKNIALGSEIGVVLQRLLEISTTKGLNIFSQSYYLQETIMTYDECIYFI